MGRKAFPQVEFLRLVPWLGSDSSIPRHHLHLWEWRREILRALLLIALGWPAVAQNAPADQQQAARDWVSNAAQALAERRTAGFLEAFDQPLAEELRKPVEALVSSYDIQPALEFVQTSGDDHGVALIIDWKLDLTAREGQRGITHRQKRVSCRVESRAGALHIAALAVPDGARGAAGFFSAPDVDGAWDLLQSAASGLGQSGVRARAKAAGFLDSFDSKLPGYEALRSGAEALAAQGDVDSTIELTSNEGTDTVRTLEVDWTLEVVTFDTGMRILQRESSLTFKIERRGKRWLIVSITPLDFFTK
jgi:hypothetical protein